MKVFVLAMSETITERDLWRVEQALGTKAPFSPVIENIYLVEWDKTAAGLREQLGLSIPAEMGFFIGELSGDFVFSELSITPRFHPKRV